MSKTALSVKDKLVLKTVKRLDSGLYECSLPTGEYKMIKLSVYGRDYIDPNALSAAGKKDNVINQLDNELSDNDKYNSNNTDVALKRNSYNPNPYHSRIIILNLYFLFVYFLTRISQISCV